MTDVVKDLCDLRKRLQDAAELCDANNLESVGGELGEIARTFDKMITDMTLTIEAIEPAFGSGGLGQTGELSMMDLCYNAFMIGRRGIPQDAEADRCDWFNDTHPLMRSGINQLRKDTIRRMEYAQAHQRSDGKRLRELENERHEVLN